MLTMKKKPQEIKHKVLESLEKHQINDQKWLPNCLKYLGYIKSTKQYEEYKKTVKVHFFNWLINTQIRAIIVFVAMLCLLASSLPPIKLILLAEGSSLSWFLFIELKRDLWRK